MLILKKSILLILFVFYPAMVFASCDFSSTDSWLLGGFYVALAADYHSTRKAMAVGRRVHPDGTSTRYHETNPLLGDYPSSTKLAVATLAAGGAVTGLACWLDDPWRKVLLSVSIAVETEAAVNNYRLVGTITF